MTPAPIVYAAGDGSGDFNCSGKDDHIPINQALKFVAENPNYTTVYLKGPFTYVIDDTLLIGSNTTLEGDLNATIKLESNAGWSSTKPLIKERNSSSMDINIRGFTLDGNREENTNVKSGDGYYNLMHLSDCQNISVCNMYLTNNHGDGLKTNNCSNIKFYNNKVYLLGHDALYASFCSNVEACNNTITCRTNSGLRLYNTNHANFHDNMITSEGSGGAGIEIQKDGTSIMDDIEVYNNTIHETALSGIWIFSHGSSYESSADVHIHHNQIYDTGKDSSNEMVSGILSDGFNATIESNVIDGTYGAGIMQDNAYFSAPSGSGYVVTVRNNIITNTRKSGAGGNGSGVCNLLTGTHAFILQNNLFYNNEGGDYTGVQASPSDIVADPQYADRDKHDYRLKSKAGRWNGSSWVSDSISSPCIDAGYSLSDYSNEPEPNGNRINIGLDGNTWYASKSELEMSNSNSGSSSSSKSSDRSSSDRSSSGSSCGSPEPANNVETKEISQLFITNDKNVRFDFTKNTTCVVYVGFYAKKTVGKTTAITEVLKNKSTLVSELPSDEVYKFFNLWVGNGGYGTSNNIENPVLCFKVEKSWIQDKKIDMSSITLNRYNDTKWNPIPTSLSGEDDIYLYFIAETPGFSSFAITGKMAEKEALTEIPLGPNTQSPEQNNGITGSEIEKKPEQTVNTSTQGKENVCMPGFEIAYGVFWLLGIFLYKRK